MNSRAPRPAFTRDDDLTTRETRDVDRSFDRARTRDRSSPARASRARISRSGRRGRRVNERDDESPAWPRNRRVTTRATRDRARRDGERVERKFTRRSLSLSRADRDARARERGSRPIDFRSMTTTRTRATTRDARWCDDDDAERRRDIYSRASRGRFGGTSRETRGGNRDATIRSVVDTKRQKPERLNGRRATTRAGTFARTDWPSTGIICDI